MLILCTCPVNIPHQHLFRFSFLRSEVIFPSILRKCDTLSDQVKNLTYWWHERKFPQIKANFKVRLNRSPPVRFHFNRLKC